ncbi:MAG: methyltransferase domain-containing protein [Gammaproteobacteria bacterium]|nr:MAG: methyltransferase domain-containing protein [Gammaproteobacteria bacterium]
MTESDLQNEIAGARAYENLHVPALFKQWCNPVLDAADINPGDNVLDVGCGTGILAREAVSRTGSHGRVTGLDPGPGMLAVARELAPNIGWEQGVAESLPYADDSFDAVVSQFGLMFFQDKAGAIREMHRVLKPGGRLAVAVWDSLEHMTAFPESVAILREHAGDAAAAALSAPFVLGDKSDLAALFHSAGVASPEITTLVGQARFPSLQAMMEADLRGWLPVMGIHLSEEQIQTILGIAGNRLADYVTADGEMVFEAPAHIVSSTK